MFYRLDELIKSRIWATPQDGDLLDALHAAKKSIGVACSKNVLVEAERRARHTA